MRQRKKIRVGLIGCNKRALRYGALFGGIDPRAFARLDPIGYHYMTYYKHVGLQIPSEAGFELVKVYDDDEKAGQTVAAAFRKRPEVCRSVAELVRGVDLVFIANESGDGACHREMATPGLEEGIPTFVDRPLAATIADAEAMISLAKRKRTPLLSCSHMKLLPHVARFKNRFAEIGPVELGVVMGQGPNPAHIADGIELTLCLFGDEFNGVPASVRSMGAWPLEILHLQFRGQRGKRVLQTLIVNSGAPTAQGAFYAKAVSQRRPVESPQFSRFVQTEGGLAVMAALKQMITVGRPSMPYQEMLASVAVAEAARSSHDSLRSVRVHTPEK